MDTHSLTRAAGFFEFIDGIRSQYGVVVLTMFVIITFLCRILRELTRLFWNDAIKVREQQIARLVKERDTYQALVFERFRAAEAVLVQTEKAATGKEDVTNTSKSEVP